MESQANWLAAAAQAELFRGIAEPEVARMLECLTCGIRRYGKNEAVVRAGDRLQSMGIVLEGRVVVQKLKPSGDLITLGTFGPGRVFGENVVFSDLREWPASVTALEPSIILFLSSEKIVSVCARRCEGHRRLIANLLRALSNRALLLNRKIEYLSCKSLRARVALFILEQLNDREQPEHVSAGGRSASPTREGALRVVELPANRAAVAEYLNMPRPSLSRELAAMKADGLIEYHRNTVRILDIRRLRAAAEDR